VVSRASGPVFMFCAPELIFDGTEGVGSRFHILRTQTRFRLYRVRRVPFSYFTRAQTHFSAVPGATCHVCMFCMFGLVFGCTDGVESRFHVCPDSFSAVPRASAPIFMFCDICLISCGTKGVRSCFHVLSSRTHFRRYRGRRVPFSCFARPDSFSAVSGATCPVFIFCATGLIFDGTEGVGSRFHILRFQTHFRQYRGLPVPFSYFALPDMFLTV
jgi:hypothetical protein